MYIFVIEMSIVSSHISDYSCFRLIKLQPFVDWISVSNQVKQRRAATTPAYNQYHTSKGFPTPDGAGVGSGPLQGGLPIDMAKIL
mmetsp:Transcript_9486/g.16168  ORF Transcript_9486/g.16168 Transcript_9486/m.16168 type:complete len:85 (+) Transcript_9486:136-390(+)